MLIANNAAAALLKAGHERLLETARFWKAYIFTMAQLPPPYTAVDGKGYLKSSVMPDFRKALFSSIFGG